MELVLFLTSATAATRMRQSPASLRPCTNKFFLVRICAIILLPYLFIGATAHLNPQNQQTIQQPICKTDEMTQIQFGRAPPQCPVPQPGGGLRSVMYFTNWGIYGRNFHAQDLKPLADSYTHILYSFANVKADTGEVVLSDPWSDTDKHYEGDSWNDPGTNVYGCVKQLFLLKKQHRKMKVLLSVGGWTYSPNFAAPMSTESGRRMFVESSVKLLEDLGFDGIDIDWEYPADSQQGENLVQLLQLLREALDAAQIRRGDATRFLATVAVAAGAKNYKNYNVAGMDRCLDFWNLMAYDYAGAWDQRAGHQANLFRDTNNTHCTPFNTHDAINFYVENGVRPDKIVLGMPLYGRTFVDTGGPGHSYNGVGEGSWENGIWDYKVLPKEGAQEFCDEYVGASWSYDGSRRVMITYDTPHMSANKARYLRQQGLGGGMWWEASGDKPKGCGSLVETFIDAVGGTEELDQTLNCLSYPDSKYDNLKAGFPNN